MPRASTKTTSDTDNGGISATDDVAALRAELAELRAGKAQAEGEVQTLKGKVRDSELAKMTAQEREVASAQEACDSKLAALEGEADSIESQIATLSDEPGHGKDIAKLTRQLTTVTASITAETSRKDYLAAQRDKVTGANKQARETAPAAEGRKLANGIAFDGLNAQTKVWLEAHPKAFTDIRYAKLATLAAQKAVEIEDLKDGSPEYFEFIESELGEGPSVDAIDPDDADGDEIVTDTRESYVPERPQVRAAGPGAFAAAPTHQVPAGPGGGRQRAPSLSSAEREAALNIYSHLNISDADKIVKYAAGKKYMAEKKNQHFASN